MEEYETEARGANARTINKSVLNKVFLLKLLQNAAAFAVAASGKKGWSFMIWSLADSCNAKSWLV